MRLLLAIVAMLMLSSLAFAAPETHQLGPYTVSFNMNTDMKYQIQTLGAQETPFFTVYPLLIATDNTTGASIGITKYKNLVDSTLQMQGALAVWSMRAKGINATSPENITIDGKKGFLVTGVPFAGVTNAPNVKFYQAQYWLDSKDCECGPVSVGMTSVDIASTYPQSVTQSMLSSLHIVKGQAT